MVPLWQASSSFTDAPPTLPQLAVLERLLWKGSSVQAPAMPQLFAFLLRMVVTLLLRRIVLDIRDSQWQYEQRGELGPWHVNACQQQQQQGHSTETHCQQRKDALCLTVRSMSLTPAPRSAAPAGGQWLGVQHQTSSCQHVQVIPNPPAHPGYLSAGTFSRQNVSVCKQAMLQYKHLTLSVANR
jgi:hypothetical protein